MNFGLSATGEEETLAHKRSKTLIHQLKIQMNKSKRNRHVFLNENFMFQKITNSAVARRKIVGCRL